MASNDNKARMLNPLVMINRQVAFLHAWQEHADQGICDELFTVECYRVFHMYVLMGCHPNMEAFIREHANRPPGYPEGPLP